MKKCGAIVLKMKHLKMKQIEKNLSYFFTEPPSFKLKQEVLKFCNTCESWSSPKIDPETNISNLKNQSFGSFHVKSSKF